MEIKINVTLHLSPRLEHLVVSAIRAAVGPSSMEELNQLRAQLKASAESLNVATQQVQK